MHSRESSSIEVTDALVDIDTHGMIRLREIARMEQALADGFHVVHANGIIEDRQEVIDADTRGPQSFAIVEGRMDAAGMDHAIAIAEFVAVDAVDIEAAFAVPLQDGDAVGMAFEHQIEGVPAEEVA